MRHRKDRDTLRDSFNKFLKRLGKKRTDDYFIDENKEDDLAFRRGTRLVDPYMRLDQAGSDLIHAYAHASRSVTIARQLALVDSISSTIGWSIKW
jgi:hypothetical protein